MIVKSVLPILVTLLIVPLGALHADERQASLWPTEVFLAEGQIRGEDFGFTDYLHQGNVVEAANGDLLVACKGNRNPKVRGSDISPNALTLWRSNDGGRSWNIVPTPFAGNHVNNYTIGNLLRFGDRLVMVGSRFAESYDHGHTWGSRESKGTDWQWKPILWFDPKIGDSHPPTGDRGFPPADEMPFCYSCRPFVLRSGGLLFMNSVAWGDSLRGKVQTRNTVYFFRSDDFGYSFQYQGAIKRGALGEVMHEPALVQLPSGRLVAFLRVDNHRTDPSGLPKGEHNLGGGRHMFLSYSDDEGRSWAEPWPCYIPTDRWNGSMSHTLLLGNNVYFVGNVSYHGMARYGAWFSHTQRCPLVLLRFPLAALEGLERGTPMPRSDAARVIETSETGRRVTGKSFFQSYDVGGPSTPHLIALRNGNIGLLYDTNTAAGSPLLLKYKEISPRWVESGRFDLWRGPRPAAVPGGFRVTNSQTEVRPVRFACSAFPIEISFTLRVGEFTPGDDFWRVISVFGHGQWVSAPGYSPFSELAAIGFEGKRPGVLLADTGAGLVDTGARIQPGRDYSVRLRLLSRHRWELYFDGRTIGDWSTQHPGLPGSFTFGYHPEKSAAVDFTYTNIQWSGPAGPLAHDDHPWIAESLDPRDVRGAEWPGRYAGMNARLHGNPHGTLLEAPGQWIECDSLCFAGRRLATGGGFAAFVRVFDETTVDLFSVVDRATGHFVRLRAEAGKLVLSVSTPQFANERALVLDGLPTGRWCFVGYAAGALQQAAWLVVDDRVSPRLCASAENGGQVPFFGQAAANGADVRAGFRMPTADGKVQGRLEVGRVWLIGRDCQPSTLLRLRESYRNSHDLAR